MKQNRLTRIDAFIVLGMIIVVFMLCLPLGRKWTKTEEQMYMGSEGIYSIDPDSYYYLRRAREFTEEGWTSLRMMYSRTDDSSITAVQSGEDDSMPQLLSALAAGIWFLLRVIGIRVGIYKLALGLCSVLLALFVVPTYVFLRKRFSRLSSIFGSLFVAIAPPFFRHSYYGFFDTDALIGLLALTMVLSLYECVLERNIKRQLVYGGIAVVANVLLYFTWTAFFVYAVIATGTTFVGLLACWLWGRRKEFSLKLTIPATFIGIIICVSFLLGGKMFLGLARGFLQKGSSGAGYWPDVTLFISELRRPAFDETTSFWYSFVSLGTDYRSYYGGLILFAFLLVSFVMLIHQIIMFTRMNEANQEQDLFVLVAIGTWLIGTVLLSLFGIRYMEFVALPSGLVMANGLSVIEKKIDQGDKSAVFKHVFFLCLGVILFSSFVLAFPALAIILAAGAFAFGFVAGKTKKRFFLPAWLVGVLLVVEMESAWLITSNQKPLINDTVADAMRWVRDNTPKNAVLADFWSLGYIYQYYGKRRTIADGGTYNGEFFYWLGTMVTTDNSKLSAGIARMLATGGIDGSEFACSLCENKENAMELLKKILVLSREDARILLEKENSFSEAQIDSLLDYSHPINCPELYYVANYRMFRGMSSLAYYRDWGFSNENEKPLFATMISIQSVKEPKNDGKAYITMGNDNNGLKWTVVVEKHDDLVEGYIQTPDAGDVICERMLYLKDGIMVYDKEIREKDGVGAFMEGTALVLIENDGCISAVACEKSMPDSVLMQLYLGECVEKEMFKKVYETPFSEELADGESMVQWKIGAREFDGSVSIWKIEFD